MLKSPHTMVENMVEQGEIARNEQISAFPTEF